MTRRLLVLGVVFSRVAVFVRQVVFFVPGFGRRFLLVDDRLPFAVGKSVQSFDELLSIIESILVFLGQKFGGHFRRLSRRESRGQAVIITGGDRIEFVVMASRTANRHAEHRFADRVELLVDDVHFQHVFVLQLVICRTE